jgi:hypothetical protein
MIRIDTTEVGALPSRFARSEAAIPGQVGKTVAIITDGVLRGARQRVPRRTGAARASLRVVGSGTTRTLTGGSHRARYYGWLEFGGSTGIRRSVRRPYRRSGRYIYPALTSEGAAITRTLDQAARNIAKAGGF